MYICIAVYKSIEFTVQHDWLGKHLTMGADKQIVTWDRGCQTTGNMAGPLSLKTWTLSHRANQPHILLNQIKSYLILRNELNGNQLNSCNGDLRIRELANSPTALVPTVAARTTGGMGATLRPQWNPIDGGLGSNPPSASSSISTKRK